jgi:hypothetical protein
MTPAAIEKRIDEIRRRLQAIGPMRPGSLSEQYTVCGKKGCRCADPKPPRKHGPYYQLSYVHQGKSTTQFIRAPFVPEVKQQLASYKRFRQLVDEWVDLALRHSRLRLEELKRAGSK